MKHILKVASLLFLSTQITAMDSTVTTVVVKEENIKRQDVKLTTKKEKKPCRKCCGNCCLLTWAILCTPCHSCTTSLAH